MKLKIKQLSMIFMLVLTLFSFSQAATQKAVVSFVSGKAEYQKSARGKWRALRVNSKVRPKDILRTYGGARLEITLQSGTRIEISENTIVSFKKLLIEGKRRDSKVKLNKGKLKFSVEKLTASGSSFEFETPTATAAIRGTQGTIATDGRQTVAYLTEGRLQLTSKSGKGSTEIEAGEMAAESKAGLQKSLVKDFKKLENKLQDFLKKTDDSTALQSLADSIVNEAAKLVFSIDNPEMEALSGAQFELRGKGLPSMLLAVNGVQKQLENANWSVTLPLPQDTGVFEVLIKAEYKGIAKQFRWKGVKVVAPKGDYVLRGEVYPWPAVLNDPFLSLTGMCNGSSVSIGTQKFPIRNGIWQADLELDPDPGLKKMRVNCLDSAGNSAIIGNVELMLEPPPEEINIRLEGGDYIEVDNGMLKIEGEVSGKEVKLQARFGAETREVPLKDGRFKIEMPVSDRLMNWNGGDVVLRATDGKQSKVQSIRYKADKTNPKINTITPVLNVSVMGNMGQIRFSLANNQDDNAEVWALMDGDEIFREKVSGNLAGKQIDLGSGVHNYTVVVKDQAGNSSEKSYTDVEFWDRSFIRLEIDSPTREGKVRVPRMPPGVADNFREPLTIRLDNLPDDDYRSLEKVTVKNSAAGFFKDIPVSRFNNSRLETELDVPVARKGRNVIEVRVTPKVGVPVVKTKIIEIIR